MDTTKHNNAVQAIMGLYTGLAFVFFLIFAAIQDGFGAAISGMLNVWQMPSQMTLDYFKHATVSGTFLNVALCCALVMLVHKVAGTKLGGVSLIGFFLTMGFACFGMTPVVMIFPMLGTILYTVVKKAPFAANANMAVFSTALGPFIGEILWRYAPLDGKPFVLRVVVAIIAGCFIGFCVPTICALAPSYHKGHTLYNAAAGAGVTAVFLYALMFKATGVEPLTNTDLGDSLPMVVNSFAIVSAVAALVLGFIFNGKSFKNVGEIFKKTGFGSDLTETPGLALINLGIFELFVTAYFNLIGSAMTGPTLAAILSLLSPVACGCHILNFLPIMIGYAIDSTFCSWTLTSQAIILGLNYAACLCPIAGAYGPIVGVIAGMIHGILVTHVATFYNALCFYSGGFTGFVTCLLLVPFLDMFFVKDSKYRINPLPIIKK